MFTNNFALKLYFIQLSTPVIWLAEVAVEDYLNLKDPSAIAVFFKHQQSKFPQIQYNKYEDRGIHPLSQWCILHITLFPQNLLISSRPISAKCINFPYFCPVYDSCLIYVFLLPLFWPWCIYASCFKLNLHLCTPVSPTVKIFHISRKFRYTLFDLTVQRKGSNKCPKCTPFGMKCSKSRRFLGLCPRPRWGAYVPPPDPLVVRGFLRSVPF